MLIENWPAPSGRTTRFQSRGSSAIQSGTSSANTDTSCARTGGAMPLDPMPDIDTPAYLFLTVWQRAAVVHARCYGAGDGELLQRAQSVNAVVRTGWVMDPFLHYQSDANATESERRIARYRPSSGPAAHAAGSRSASSTVSRNASTGSSVSKG